MMPAPNVLAGALSRRTENAKICVLGRALPLTGLTGMFPVASATGSGWASSASSRRFKNRSSITGKWASRPVVISMQATYGIIQPVFVTTAPGDSRLHVLDQAGVIWVLDGEDAYGYKMNPKYDQFMGFTGIA